MSRKRTEESKTFVIGSKGLEMGEPSQPDSKELIKDTIPNVKKQRRMLQNEMGEFWRNLMTLEQQTTIALQEQQLAIAEKDDEIAKLKAEAMSLKRNLAEMILTNGDLKKEMGEMQAKALAEAHARTRQANAKKMQSELEKKKIRNETILEVLNKMKDGSIEYYKDQAQINNVPADVEYSKPLSEISFVLALSIDDLEAGKEARNICRAINMQGKLAFNQEKERLQQPAPRQTGNTIYINQQNLDCKDVRNEIKENREEIKV